MNRIYIKKPGNVTLVMVATPNGAFNEPQDIKGISHFVEHMCFKGNSRRNQKEISSSIDNIGGNINERLFKLSQLWKESRESSFQQLFSHI